MLRSTVLLALSLASLAHEETELLQRSVNEISSLKSVASSVTSVTSSVTSISVPINIVLTDKSASGGSTLERMKKQATAVESLTKNTKGKGGIWESIKSTFHSGWQTVKSWCGISPEDSSPEAQAKRKQEEAEAARAKKALEDKCKQKENEDDPDCKSWGDSIGNFFGFGKKKEEELTPDQIAMRERETQAQNEAKLKHAENEAANLEKAKLAASKTQTSTDEETESTSDSSSMAKSTVTMNGQPVSASKSTKTGGKTHSTWGLPSMADIGRHEMRSHQFSMMTGTTHHSPTATLIGGGIQGLGMLASGIGSLMH